MAETRTSLARPNVGLRPTDMALLELPNVDASSREYAIWEFTGFPSWWAMRGDEYDPSQTFRRQLRESPFAPTVPETSNG